MSVFLLFFLILKSERFNERTERLVVVVVIDREKSAGCRGGGFIFRAHLSTFVVYVVVYVVEGIFGGGGGKEGGVSSAYFFVKEAKSRSSVLKTTKKREREREEGGACARMFNFYAIRNNHHQYVLKSSHQKGPYLLTGCSLQSLLSRSYPRKRVRWKRSGVCFACGLYRWPIRRCRLI